MEFKQCSINGKIYASLDEVKTLLNSGKHALSSADFQAVHEFFKLMAVCHTVVLDTDKDTGKVKM